MNHAADEDPRAEAIHVWRHPRAVTPSPGQSAAGLAVGWAKRSVPTGSTPGRCTGSTDTPIDRRKAKRLARRVQGMTRQAGLPRIVVTSHLRRCADVGRWLRRWGWIHRIDASIAEIHFGDWEGRSWDDIGQSKLDEWVADFAAYAPGGGESLLAMLERAASWHTTEPVVVIGHAGWMLARRWLEEGRDSPASAAQWPKAPKHGSLWRLSPHRFRPEVV